MKLQIKEEKFYNNGKIFLEAIKLRSGKQLEVAFREALSQEIQIDTITRKTKQKGEYGGVGANDLNKKIRECLSSISEINKETHVKNGVFILGSKEGFDFSIYDKEYNFSSIYNYYVGEKGILNGDNKLKELKASERGNLSKEEFEKKVEKIKNSLGGYNIDYLVDKEILSIVGEIQFGNWALAYRDIIRLLKANTNPGIDFYIYITSTGKLKKCLANKRWIMKKSIEFFGKIYH